MARILIADDEALERKALRFIIQSSHLGDSMRIDEAENGVEALKQAMGAQYSAIFLDIKMPGLDGLAVAEAIRKANNHCPIVILSAFDTFEYAQKAIRLGVYEYLLKPAGAEEVVSALQRTLALGEDERQLSMKKEESISILHNVEKKLKQTLEEQMGKASIEESAIKEFENLASLSNTERFALALRIELKSGTSPKSLSQAIAGKALEAARMEAQRGGGKALCAKAGDSAFIIVYGFQVIRSKDQSNDDPLSSIIEIAGKAIQDVAPSSLFCGLAGPSLESAEDLFARAVEAVQLASQTYPNVRLSPWVEPNRGQDRRYTSDAPRELGGGLGLKALDYIKMNYSKAITLVSVAERLGVNSFHLSHVISKELGIGFSELLARLRINKAKELISGGANIKEASHLVGFSDQAYFTRVFKKLEKSTPRRYFSNCAKKYK